MNLLSVAFLLGGMMSAQTKVARLAEMMTESTGAESHVL